VAPHLSGSYSPASPLPSGKPCSCHIVAAHRYAYCQHTVTTPSHRLRHSAVISACLGHAVIHAFIILVIYNVTKVVTILSLHCHSTVMSTVIILRPLLGRKAARWRTPCRRNGTLLKMRASHLHRGRPSAPSPAAPPCARLRPEVGLNLLKVFPGAHSAPAASLPARLLACPPCCSLCCLASLPALPVCVCTSLPEHVSACGPAFSCWTSCLPSAVKDLRLSPGKRRHFVGVPWWAPRASVLWSPAPAP